MSSLSLGGGGLRPLPALAGSVSSVAIFALAAALPELGLLALVSALPLGLVRFRAGLPSALAGGAAAVVAILGLAGASAALSFLAVVLAPALLVAEALAGRRGIPVALLWGFAWAGSAIGLALIQPGADWGERATEPLRHYQSREFLDDVRSRGVPEEQVDALSRQFAALERAMSVVYPAAFLILAALAVLINAVLLRARLASRSDEAEAALGPGFEELRLPLGVTVVFVASGAALVSPPLRPLAYNALTALGFLFGLQGLAVVIYYVSRFRGPRLLRFAIVVLLLLIPIGIYVVPLLGLLDIWFDFRRWARRPEPADRGGEGNGDSGQRD